MNAYMKGNREITKKLIDECVSPNFEDSKEDPILICALKKGDYEFVKIFLDKGANPNTRSRNSIPALSFLVACG